MTRQEHLDWCKKRALEYVDRGELGLAYASMISDLGKHPQTVNSLGTASKMVGQWAVTAGEKAMRDWVEGFN